VGPARTANAPTSEFERARGREREREGEQAKEGGREGERATSFLSLKASMTVALLPPSRPTVDATVSFLFSFV